MKNLGQMMKQAQQMQSKLQEMQQRLDEVEVSGVSGAGMVRVTVNGKYMLKSLKIDPSVAGAEDVEVLEDLILAAYNDAKAKAEIMAREQMSALTGGLNLPPGFNLPF